MYDIIKMSHISLEKKQIYPKIPRSTEEPFYVKILKIIGAKLFISHFDVSNLNVTYLSKSPHT